MSDIFTREMQSALEADAEKLQQLTGENHSVAFVADDLKTELNEIVNPALVIADTELSLKTRPTATIEQALVITERHVHDRAHGYYKAFMLDKLENLYGLYCMTNGEYDKTWRLYKKEPWTDGLDDMVADMLEPYAKLLTSDWLGRHVTDVRLYDPGIMESIADGFAEDIYRNLTYLHKFGEEGSPKTPVQILSSVGVLRADIEAMLETRSTPEEIKEIHMNTLESALGRINAFVSMIGMDDKTLKDLLDNASDNDPGLAASGISQVGGEAGDIEALQFARLTNGLDGLVAMVREGGLTSQPQPSGVIQPHPAPIPTTAQPFELAPAQIVPVGPEKVTLTAPPPAKRTRAKSNDDGVPQQGQIPPQALLLLKDHSGLNSEALGGLIGVARATFDNYAKGKGRYFASQEAYSALDTLLDAKIGALSLAKQLIASTRQ